MTPRAAGHQYAQSRKLQFNIEVEETKHYQLPSSSEISFPQTATTTW